MRKLFFALTLIFGCQIALAAEQGQAGITAPSDEEILQSVMKNNSAISFATYAYDSNAEKIAEKCTTLRPEIKDRFEQTIRSWRSAWAPVIKTAYKIINENTEKKEGLTLKEFVDKDAEDNMKVVFQKPDAQVNAWCDNFLAGLSMPSPVRSLAK